MDLIHPLLNLPRTYKRIITLLVDSCFIFVAFWCALLVRLDSFLVFYDMSKWVLFFLVLPTSLVVFIRLGLYRAVIRYMSSQALGAVLIGASISTLSLVLFSFSFEVAIPRTVPLIYACFTLLLIGGSRVTVRAFVGKAQIRLKEPVIIYGAGSAGRQLAVALHNSGEYQAVAFIDDNIKKRGEFLSGIEVFHSKDVNYVINLKSVNKILLAIPSLTRSRRKEILLKLEALPIRVMSIPCVSDLVNGKQHIDEIKEVDIVDLLGRESVTPNPKLLKSDIIDKIVMVTGAGGSIGSELCRQIIKQKPSKLILFELSEFGLYKIEKELNQLLSELGLNIELIPLLGSVQRKNRLTAVFNAFKVQTLYHAAAYKHVPLVEHNVVEGVRNNVFGTLFTAQAAIEADVETFVLISTDKAVRPTNVMGASKRMAELVLQALANQQHNTRFCMVRFGNVLGSSGSVVPLFRKQIEKGGPVTLTHQEITRYFMTIPEAAQLVIQAGAMGKGGDVFVLDMGQPVKIRDLAVKMIHLSGLEVKSEHNLHGDIEIKCTGLRPGEKLYEELLVGDNVSGTKHERIMTASESFLPWSKLNELISVLDTACHNFDHKVIRETLLAAPTAFSPKDGICDLVWHELNKAPKILKLKLKTVI